MATALPRKDLSRACTESAAAEQVLHASLHCNSIPACDVVALACLFSLDKAAALGRHPPGRMKLQRLDLLWRHSRCGGLVRFFPPAPVPLCDGEPPPYPLGSMSTRGGAEYSPAVVLPRCGRLRWHLFCAHVPTPALGQVCSGRCICICLSGLCRLRDLFSFFCFRVGNVCMHSHVQEHAFTRSTMFSTGGDRVSVYRSMC